MNVDFRLYRRIARGACSAALIGSLLGGCASTHKPRFWDKEDGTTVADANGTQPNANPTATASTPAAAVVAPTVVAADHTTPADPASGPVSAFDFPDASPSTQVASVSDSQPAPAAKSAPTSDAFDDGFGPRVPLKGTGNVAATTTTASTSSPKTVTAQSTAPGKASDPFADPSASPAVSVGTMTPVVERVACRDTDDVAQNQSECESLPQYGESRIHDGHSTSAERAARGQRRFFASATGDSRAASGLCVTVYDVAGRALLSCLGRADAARFS